MMTVIPRLNAACYSIVSSLQWRHNDHDGVPNHHRLDCLLNRLLRRRSKKTSKLRVTGLCEGNSPVAGEFPAQSSSSAENVSIWWRYHVFPMSLWRSPYTSAALPSQWCFECIIDPFPAPQLSIKTSAQPLGAAFIVYDIIYLNWITSSYPKSLLILC